MSKKPRNTQAFPCQFRNQVASTSLSLHLHPTHLLADASDSKGSPLTLYWSLTMSATYLNSFAPHQFHTNNLYKSTINPEGCADTSFLPATCRHTGRAKNKDHFTTLLLALLCWLPFLPLFSCIAVTIHSSQAFREDTPRVRRDTPGIAATSSSPHLL